MQKTLLIATFVLANLALWVPLPSSAQPIACRYIWSEPSSASTPLFKDFLKQPLEDRHSTDPMSDLKEQIHFSSMDGIAITPASNHMDRLAALQDVDIASVVAAPGHRKLRNPLQVEGLTKYIRDSHGGNFSHDPLLLNIVTDSHGHAVSVDLWNAHHRLVAYLSAGYKRIGEIPAENINILVDGVHTSGEKWGHFLSIGGLDFTEMKDYSSIPAVGYIRVGTISVDGARSNFSLGSRNTVGQLLTNTMVKKSPRIGVYFGTFDPVHEGHIAVVKAIMEKYQLDEVVLVPNITPSHKPQATSSNQRIEMLKIRVEKEDHMNLYIAPSEVIVNQFGRDPLMERFTQTYGSHDIYQIIGSDSFRGSIESNSITEKSNRHFIVVPRDAHEVVEVPGHLKNIVSVTEMVDEKGLSSTKVRNQIKNNQQPAEDVLDPDVYSYIRQHSLYQP